MTHFHGHRRDSSNTCLSYGEATVVDQPDQWQLKGRWETVVDAVDWLETQWQKAGTPTPTDLTWLRSPEVRRYRAEVDLKEQRDILLAGLQPGGNYVSLRVTVCLSADSPDGTPCPFEPPESPTSSG
ncbi:hypothetical protein [Kitasatospora sp. NPDC088351]|uniref:hypothetical protein n=1 Tax=Kitasatospora sp. NPDC088351 TaxID=3155180 RepID=UPI0034254467